MSDGTGLASPAPLFPDTERRLNALPLAGPLVDAERQEILAAFERALAARYAPALNDGTRRNIWKEACRQSRRAGQILPADTERHYRALAEMIARTVADLHRDHLA